jgi:hypothetical protein
LIFGWCRFLDFCAAKRRNITEVARGIQALLKPEKPTFDNTKSLAAKARALITENGPGAIRDRLREIADALDAMMGSEPLERIAA